MAGQSCSSTAVTRTRRKRIDESQENQKEWWIAQRTKPEMRWSPARCHQFQKFILKPDDLEEYAILEQ